MSSRDLDFSDQEQLNENHRVSRLCDYRHAVQYLDHLFDDHKAYVDFTEDAMKRSVDEINEIAAQEYAAGNNPKDLTFDYERFKITYPERFRSSTLIHLFSIIEDEFNDLCEIARQAYRTEISVTDIKGTGLQRAKLYISKISGFNKWDEESWKTLKKYQIIRNAKVHARGQVKHKNAVQDIVGIEWLRDDFASLQYEFLQTFIDFSAKYLPNMITLVSQHIRDDLFRYVKYKR